MGNVMSSINKKTTILANRNRKAIYEAAIKRSNQIKYLNNSELFDNDHKHYTGGHAEIPLKGTPYSYEPDRNIWTTIEIFEDRSDFRWVSYSTEEVLELLGESHPEIAEELLFNLDIFI